MSEEYSRDSEVHVSRASCPPAPHHVALFLVPDERSPPTAHRERAPSAALLCDAVLELQALGVEHLTLQAFGDLSAWVCRAAPSEARRFSDFVAYATPCLVAAGIRVAALGALEELAPSLRRGLERLIHVTRRGRGMSLTLLISYRGRTDIVETARHLATHVRAGLLIPEDIDEELFRTRMQAAEVPNFDVCIRLHDAPPPRDLFPFQSSNAETLDVACDIADIGAELARALQSTQSHRSLTLEHSDYQDT
ncbi:MAG TPA: undecaprenyl diphosphate synthase family protein [Polyangiaceae bacterium]|nr:undecaprenyl diphosphate synthase family protein [Polyangiaceae bacterium]